MANNTTTRNSTFDLILDGRFETLGEPSASQHDLHSFLPYLLRISDGARNTTFSFSRRLAFDYPQVNQILNYMRLDFSQLCSVIEQEILPIRRRLWNPPTSPPSVDVVTQFENGNEEIRARLTMTEVMELVEYQQQLSTSPPPSQTQQPLGHPTLPTSEILRNETYIQENCIIISVALSRLCSILSPPDVVRSLLPLKTSRFLILAIVANYPAGFHDIIGSLVVSSSSPRYQQNVSAILRDICDMAPHSSLHIRSLLVRQQVLPSLALDIAVKQSDQIEFLSSLLDEHTWIKDYIRDSQSQPSSPISFLRTHLLSTLRESSTSTEASTSSLPTPLSPSSSSSSLSSSSSSLTIAKRLQMASLLRLYCGLTGLMSLRLNSEEINACLSILTPNVLAHPSSYRIVKLGICFLLLCQDLLKIANKKHVLDCFSNLLKSGHCSEMLLLIAIHFHTNQPMQVVEFIRSNLILPVSIHVESLTSIGNLITEGLLIEERVAREAGSLAIVPELSTTSSSHVVTCVYHLLKGRIFSRHEVDVSNWAFRQIKQASEPIHHLLPALLEELVECTLTTGFRMKRYQENDIRQFFRDTSSSSSSSSNSIPKQILMLYYVLTFNDRSVQKAAAAANPPPGKEPVKTRAWEDRDYSMELLDSLPVKHLLTYAQTHSKEYSNIYPPLLNLVVTQFPQLFTVVNLLVEEEQLWNISKASDERTSCLSSLSKNTLRDIETFKTAMEHSLERPEESFAALQQLLLLSPIDVRPYVDVLLQTLLPKLLTPRADSRLTLLFVSLWETLNTALPWDFCLKTFNQLRLPEGRNFHHNDLVTDPLIILRADNRVFLKPPILRILLQILGAYMVASRKNLNTLTQLSAANKDEVNALMLTQDSAIVQVLFEICASSSSSSSHDREKRRYSSSYSSSSVSSSPHLRSIFVASTTSSSASASVNYGTVVPMELDSFKVEEDEKEEEDEVETEEGEKAEGKEEEEQEGKEAIQEEIRTQICTFVHQLFIENPLLIKLVHFQGYLLSLLPITAHGIPSMHVCLEFITELLSQPQLEKRVFGVHLGSHLVEKYPIPRSLVAARAILIFLRNSRNSSSDSVPFLIQTLSALVRICKAFPFLTEEVVDLLLEVAPGTTLLSDTTGLSPKFASLTKEVVSVYQSLIREVLSKHPLVN